LYENEKGARKRLMKSTLSGLREVDFARPDSYLFIRGQHQPSPYQIANLISGLKSFR